MVGEKQTISAGRLAQFAMNWWKFGCLIARDFMPDMVTIRNQRDAYLKFCSGRSITPNGIHCPLLNSALNGSPLAIVEFSIIIHRTRNLATIGRVSRAVPDYAL